MGSGAPSAACFDQLAQEIPGLRIYTLRENYRSTPQILEAAQKALQRPCQLQATQPAGCPVRHVLAPTPFAEACWIAEEIGRLTGGLDMLAAGHGSVEQPRPFGKATCAVPTGQLNVLEACLARQGIPCVVRGREDYLEDPAVQGAIGFFRSLYQPADQAALTACLTHAFQCPPDLAPAGCSHLLSHGPAGPGHPYGRFRPERPFGPLGGRNGRLFAPLKPAQTPQAVSGLGQGPRPPAPPWTGWRIWPPSMIP